MKDSLATQRLRLVLRLVVGLLFVWAALPKLANPLEFLGSLYAYELPVGRGILKLTAVVLPWTELLCGLMLVADVKTSSALLCTLGMLLVFLVATGQAWVRGLQIACGCFDLSFLGQGEGAASIHAALESVAFAFFRNLLLAAACLWMLRKHAVSAPSVASRKPIP